MESFPVATAFVGTMKKDQSQAMTAEQSVSPLVNMESERGILGRVLADERVWSELEVALTPEDFGSVKHGMIFRAMLSLSLQGRPISQATVSSRMGETETVDTIHVGSYLDSLIAEARKPEIARHPIAEFVRVIKHRAGCRKLIAVCDKIKREAERATTDTDIDVLQKTASSMIEEADGGEIEEETKMGVLAARVIDEVQRSKTSGVTPGLLTGFPPFDDLIGPLRPGQLIVIAGETGSGKTALATQLGVSLAEQNHPVRLTSLEMEEDEIMQRVLAHHADLSSQRMMNGAVSDREMDELFHAGERVVHLPFYVDDKPRQSIGTIQARLARAQRKLGIKVAIIDHLQYVRSDLSRGDLHEKVAQVVDDAKAMAKRLKIVVLLLSHVNRTADLSMINTAADVKRPFLNQLYGSSAIEKAADAVLFVHRPIWFLDRATPLKKYLLDWEGDKAMWRGKAELVMPKRRNGAGFGTRKVYFDEEKTWFREMETNEYGYV